jgi:prepilin-type N-terminal cleavage/methylation domain-containing protein
MRDGFNLVEVLVASAILAVVFLPLFGVFQSGVRTTKYTEDRLRAMTIAQEQVQTVRHAATINRHSVDAVVRAHLVQSSFAPYVVDGRYKVTTEIDPDFLVRFGVQEATVLAIKVTVEWKLVDQVRSLTLESLLDRAYD